MSPFLPTLFAVTLVEIGNANAQFSSSLTARAVPPVTVLRALGAVNIVVMGLAAAGGYALGTVEPMNARVLALLLGMALIWAAAGQFRTLKPVADVEGQDANIIALRGFARLALTGSAGFVVFAIGLYGGASLDAFFGAALGGWLGVMVANLPPVLMEKRQARQLRIPMLRSLAGGLLALCGFYFALGAVFK
jgi:putative Ca2+/H+ antiporter (TMEM165/GDT1 family)